MTTVDYKNRHPGVASIMRFFAHDHLAEPMRSRARECASLAQTEVAALSDSPELVAGLRKLLEAKDCFVRASIE